YLTSLTDEKALPPIAAQRVSAWVGDKIPYIQESALDATKDTLRPAVRAKLPALIEDADINVRMSAAHLAQRSKEASCRDALLRRLAAAASKWEIDAMKYALD